MTFPNCLIMLIPKSHFNFLSEFGVQVSSRPSRYDFWVQPVEAQTVPPPHPGVKRPPLPCYLPRTNIGQLICKNDAPPHGVSVPLTCCG